MARRQLKLSEHDRIDDDRIYDGKDEKSGHHAPGFVSPGVMQQRQSSPKAAITAASQPLSALHMQIMRRLQWSNEGVVVHRQRPGTAQLDDKGASRAIATTQKTSFFRVLACGEQRPCLCPMDSDICARANTTRAAFIAAILNEDVERLGAFASQFVEEPALTLLYKYRFKEFQDAGETQQAGEGRSGGGKTGLMIAASMGLVASAEYLIGFQMSLYALFDCRYTFFLPFPPDSLKLTEELGV